MDLNMAELMILAVVAGSFVLKGVGLLAVVYFGARLAIRHERRV